MGNAFHSASFMMAFASICARAPRLLVGVDLPAVPASTAGGRAAYKGDLRDVFFQAPSSKSDVSTSRALPDEEEGSDDKSGAEAAFVSDEKSESDKSESDDLDVFCEDSEPEAMEEQEEEEAEGKEEKSSSDSDSD